MNANYYGTTGYASFEPKQIVIKFMRKIILNNKNAIKYLENNDIEEYVLRLNNSIHILEELDLMLNRDTENPTVDRVSLHYQWMIEVFESIVDKTDDMEFCLEQIKMTEPVINDLLEGFSEMRD
ncbi:flagellar protein FliS [Bacillus cereus]|uniref:flagellar protein FliS n=1 Tax=Bacillus cereus TaxID=1396 RepID=UPI000B4B344E|nr:flagellar protein FliS [Bacillus cereus]